MGLYNQLKYNSDAPKGKYFFAFSNEQFEKNKAECGITTEKICSAGHGMYGTREAIDDFIAFHENKEKLIIKKCTPQEVYDDEFSNHECSYVGDDRDAIEHVIDLFGRERTKVEVKRRYAHSEIDIIGTDEEKRLEEMKHRYSLLDRLREDCKYYLNVSPAEKHLWAGSVYRQIEKMKELYNSFSDSEKPEWISMEEILEFERKMKNHG